MSVLVRRYCCWVPSYLVRNVGKYGLSVVATRSIVLEKQNRKGEVTTSAFSLPSSSSSAILAWKSTYSTSAQQDIIKSSNVVYIAPFSSAVRVLKVVSITTFFLTITSSPLIVLMGSEAAPLAGRIAMSSVVTLFGCTTTFLLTWFTKCYITKMYFDKTSGQIVVESYNIFAQKRQSQFHVSECKPPSNYTMSSFNAKGKNFFLHMEVFEDRELLTKLIGAEQIAVMETMLDDDDDD